MWSLLSPSPPLKTITGGVTANIILYDRATTVYYIKNTRKYNISRRNQTRALNKNVFCYETETRKNKYNFDNEFIKEYQGVYCIKYPTPIDELWLTYGRPGNYFLRKLLW